MNSNELALGIDIGGTNLKVGLVSADGELLDKETTPTPKPRELREVVAALAETVRALCDKHGVTPLGAGIGAPGVVDETMHTVLWAPNFKDWIGEDRKSVV